MADVTADIRSRVGTAADRKMPLTTSLSTGAAVGAVIGLSDWLLQCYATGNFQYVAPPKALVEVVAPLTLLPVIHFGARVATLLARKILDALGDGEDA